jgi:hypothetical protein
MVIGNPPSRVLYGTRQVHTEDSSPIKNGTADEPQLRAIVSHWNRWARCEYATRCIQIIQSKLFLCGRNACLDVESCVSPIFVALGEGWTHRPTVLKKISVCQAWLELPAPVRPTIAKCRVHCQYTTVTMPLIASIRLSLSMRCFYPRHTHRLQTARQSYHVGFQTSLCAC